MEVLGEEMADVVLHVASIAEMTGLDLHRVETNAARPEGRGRREGEG